MPVLWAAAAPAFLCAQTVPPVWTADLPARPEGPPFAGEGRAFQPLSDGTLLSVDLETGTETRIQALGEGFVGGITLAQDRIWWAEPGGKVAVAAFPEATILGVWQLEEGALHRPVPAGSCAAVGTETSLVLLEAGRAEALAVHALPGRPSAPPAAWQQRLGVPVATPEGGGLLLVFDLGRPSRPPLFRLPLPGAPTTPVIRDGEIYVGDGAGHLSAFRFRGTTGRGARRIWRRRTGGPVLAPPVLLYRSVVWTALDNWIYHVSSSTGMPRAWIRSPRRVGRPLLALPGAHLVLAPEASDRLIEIDLPKDAPGRSWSVGTEGDLVQTPAAADADGRWLLASFGPYRWRLAAFDLWARPPEEAPAPQEGEAPPDSPPEAPRAEGQGVESQPLVEE